MNNFATPGADAKSKVPKHLESLATTVFQSLFPPIKPQQTPLQTIRRVLLLNREPNSEQDDGTFIVNFRHYAITTKSTTVSKPLKRLQAAEKLMTTKSSRRGRMPNLGKLEDIADYMAEDGYMTDATSGSEVESDAEVEVVNNAPRRVLSSKARLAAERGEQNGQAHDDGGDDDVEQNVERRAVKLVELGPRMRLRLTKVEEGLCDGKVMWHEYVHKTSEQVKELERRWERRRQEKAARKREQKANVERKQAEKEAKKQKKSGDADGDEDEDEDDDEEEEAYSDVDFDDFVSDGSAEDAEMQDA